MNQPQAPTTLLLHPKYVVTRYNRVLLYGFPTQMAALKRPIFDFLNQIFEPTRYHANATLRGFYFTSGTQHGTPIDRLIGALAKSFGSEQVGAHAHGGGARGARGRCRAPVRHKST